MVGSRRAQLLAAAAAAIVRGERLTDVYWNGGTYRRKSQHSGKAAEQRQKHKAPKGRRL